MGRKFQLSIFVSSLVSQKSPNLKKKINVPSKIRTYRVDSEAEKNKRTSTFIGEVRVHGLFLLQNKVFRYILYTSFDFSIVKEVYLHVKYMYNVI